MNVYLNRTKGGNKLENNEKSEDCYRKKLLSKKYP